MSPSKRTRPSASAARSTSAGRHSESSPPAHRSAARRGQPSKVNVSGEASGRQADPADRTELPARSFPGAVRNTRQRNAVIAVFDRIERPLSPEEILNYALREVAGMGIATIYRSVKQLVLEGYLTAVELPGEPPRYERAGKHHHHHFMCRTCDQVFEIDGCPGDFKRLAPKGFRIEDHSITLYGLCSQCVP